MTPSPDLFVGPAYILTIPHVPAVERCILDLALRFALLGRTDAARQFTELLYSRPTLENHNYSGLRALVVHWRLTHFPAGIPEDLKTDADFDDYIESRDQEGSKWPFYVQPENRTEDEAGLDLMLSPGQNHPRYDEREPELGPALELAVKLAEGRGVDPSNDPKVNEILAALSKRPIDTLQDAFLVGSPRCAPIFMSGALARTLNLSDEELDSRATELLEASRQRYWHGRSSRGPETILDLLQTCSDNSVAKSDQDWAEMELEKPATLFRSPASKEHISALEQKLNVTLPEDFKAFLRISNGFGGIWVVFPGPPLRSTDDIDWLDYSEYELVCNQLTVFSLPHFWAPAHLGGGKLPDPPIFTNVICIASEDIYDVWLIPPQMMQQMRDYYKGIYATVNDDGKRIIERAIDDFAGSWDEWNKLDWGCVSWATGGSAHLECFSSFKAWLENSAWNTEYVDD